MSDIEWGRLQALHEAAKQCSVSFALHYAESDDSWFVTITSPAPTECFCGKNMSFDSAMDCAIEWLKGLQ